MESLDLIVSTLLGFYVAGIVLVVTGLVSLVTEGKKRSCTMIFAGIVMVIVVILKLVGLY